MRAAVRTWGRPAHGDEATTGGTRLGADALPIGVADDGPFADGTVSDGAQDDAVFRAALEPACEALARALDAVAAVRSNLDRHCKTAKATLRRLVDPAPPPGDFGFGTRNNDAGDEIGPRDDDAYPF